MKKRHLIAGASALGGAIVTGGVLIRLLFSPPSDFVDTKVKEEPTQTQTAIQTLQPSTELKLDVLSTDLGKMLLEEDDIPRDINEKVLSYRSWIQSGYPVQCKYPQIEKDSVPRQFPSSFGQSAKYCFTYFTVELQDINDIITALAIYNSVGDAKAAFGQYTSFASNEPDIRDLIIKTRTIGNEILVFGDLTPSKMSNGYAALFRNDNVIGYVLAIEPPTQHYLDLENILEMAETLNDRIRQ